MTNKGLREKLAAHAHEQWSGWMRYIFGRCHSCSDGTAVIPAWAVERWKRQMETPYNDLPEEERVSDQREADRILAIVEAG